MKQAPRHPRAAKGPTEAGHRSLPAWKLQDAKAHFSQVVREAREQGPQRVTLHGKDAVVILSAEDYARLAPAAAQPGLHALLSRSPLQRAWNSSTEVSALRCAMSSCERLAIRYQT